MNKKCWTPNSTSLIHPPPPPHLYLFYFIFHLNLKNLKKKKKTTYPYPNPLPPPPQPQKKYLVQPQYCVCFKILYLSRCTFCEKLFLGKKIYLIRTDCYFMEPKVTVNYLHENKEIIHSMIYYMMKYKSLSQEQKVLKRNNQH